MCYATAHHLAGFASGAALATAAHQSVWVAVASACLASLTAGGVLSPDVDQFRVWRALDRWLPDEWLGAGGPLQHRGVSHWWGIPAAVAAWLYVSGGPWWAWMLLAGWVSHLVCDWAFGKRAWGRGPGIPVGPWFWHHGLGLDAGGWVEVWLLIPALVLVSAGLVVHSVVPDQPVGLLAGLAHVLHMT